MTANEQQLLIESIGEKLKSARLRKKINPSKAAADTRIKVQMIEAMERDDFSGIPAVAYAKGFIKLYAEYLDLDPEPLVREYVEQHTKQKQAEASQEEPKKQKKRGKAKTSFLKPAPPDEDGDPRPRRSIALPKIRLPKISLPSFKLPKITLPKLHFSSQKIRKVVPWVLAVAALLIAFTGIRACGKKADESSEVIVSTVHESRSDSPVALIEEPPEPYLKDDLLPGE
ncbi:MAG: helix-turn-helix domain-containing protein [Verrucomicrobia bacterium]|nr:helix-turn-helix domain-containing protein [Verrucomicrobiota bacterium]